ncbi:hypothetical protein D018_2946B, partial [Vibrio parahaemolyticus VP2007-007]
DVLLTH